MDTSTHAFCETGHVGTKETGFPIIWRGRAEREGLSLGKTIAGWSLERGLVATIVVRPFFNP